VRGGRSGFPAREALILLAVINHPGLLETHAEDLAELESATPMPTGCGAVSSTSRRGVSCWPRAPFEPD